MATTLQDLLHRHFKNYSQSHRLSVAQRRAGAALSACRTARLGGHVSRCPNGHVERVWYNSCRHRACPQCNALPRERWLEKMRARLIACAHHHVIFTIPHELNALWMLNTPALMQALFAAVRSTLTELLDDPRYLGAQVGAVMALHTWSRALALHPHIHALITDGGLSESGLWVSPKRSDLLPARVVMALFRGKLLGALRALHKASSLRLPETLSAAHLERLLNRLGRVKWNVRVQQRYAHGEGVSVYLARYVKGGAINNAQIIQAADERVDFRYRPHGARAPVTMRLAPQRFLARVLVHAPEPRRHSVRYVGLYAARHSAALNQARALNDQPPAEAPAPISCEDFLARFANAHERMNCPQCGARLIRSARLAPVRAPP
jgi:hypothetical protein